VLNGISVPKSGEKRGVGDKYDIDMLEKPMAITKKSKK